MYNFESNQEIQFMYHQQNPVTSHQDSPNILYQQSNFYSDQHDSPRQTPLLQVSSIDKFFLVSYKTCAVRIGDQNKTSENGILLETWNVSFLIIQGLILFLVFINLLIVVIIISFIFFVGNGSRYPTSTTIFIHVV